MIMPISQMNYLEGKEVKWPARDQRASEWLSQGLKDSPSDTPKAQPQHSAA